MAVVDESGHLIAFRRMDGAKFSSVEIAINKAFTSSGAGARRGTTRPVSYTHLTLPTNREV